MNPMSNAEDFLAPIGEAANLIGVSVRTLRYWEEKEVVCPSYRNWADHRLYTIADIERAQLVLVYKATGMSLSQIRVILQKPESRITHLRRQRALLSQKENELNNMVRALDTLLEEAMNSEHHLSVAEIGEILQKADFPKYQEEAAQKWGDTSEYQIAEQTTAHMSASQWHEIKATMEDFERRCASTFHSGVDPDSPEAIRLAAEHRDLVSHFFPLSLEQHVLLAQSYLADERFVQHYDHRVPGLCAWLVAAVSAHAQAQGIDLDRLQWR